MDVKIELTINDTTKEEFNLVVYNQENINDLLWEIRLKLKERLND